MADPFTPGLLQRLNPPPRKVVLLRASRVGDFLCAAPAFRALRNALPEAEISLITLPMLGDLAARLPYFDRVLAFPGFPGIAEQLFDPRRAIQFFQKAQSEAFDLAIQMQGSGVYSNPFILLLGARTTAGFIRPGDPAGRLDAVLALPEEGHEIDRVLALTTYLGAPPDGRQVGMRLLAQDFEQADRLFGEAPRPWIGVHPAARDRTRRWPVARFAEAARRLQAAAGGTVSLLGEAEEAQTAEAVLSTLGGPGINLTGQTGLPDLAAVIARLGLLLTNDTGPAHLAYASGTPSLTVFGGGDPNRYGPPLDGPHRVLAHPVPCRPCSYTECPIGYICLENISVEMAVTAGQALLGEAKAGSR